MRTKNGIKIEQKYFTVCSECKRRAIPISKEGKELFKDRLVVCKICAGHLEKGFGVISTADFWESGGFKIVPFSDKKILILKRLSISPSEKKED